MKREMFKINGYIFSDEKDGNEIEDKFFKWLQEHGYYFVGIVDMEEDEIKLYKD